MFLFYHAIVYINYFGILIYCVQGTSKIGGDSYSQSAGIFCSSSNCRQHTAVIAGSIVGGGIIMILILIGILFCCCHCRGQSSQTNLKFVNTTNKKHNIYDNTQFKSGIWSSRYLQCGIWHGPNCFALSFDSRSLKVTGSGADHIGMFIIDGTYSIRTGRMGLTKIYQFPNRNQSEYQIIIQLIWNSETRQFEGKRYVQTKTYREENRFELKFSKQTQPSSSKKI